MMIIRKSPKLISLIIPLIFVSCVSIPPEAPELSSELGSRITAIEEANLTLLHRYFDHKRTEVNRFIQEEWVPLFAKNLFKEKAVRDAWDIVVRENNQEQALQLLIRLGPRLEKRINDQRQGMLEELDFLEHRIEDQIRNEYAQAKGINEVITSLLLSASDVVETRSRYLEKAGLTEAKMQNIIDKTDIAVSNLLNKTNQAEGYIQHATEFINNIQNIRKSIE